MMTSAGSTPAALRVDDLSVAYRQGGFGVQGISFEAAAGKTVVLLGPNGAGKTSTLRAIAGFLPRDAGYVHGGRLEFLGNDITNMAPLRRSRQGLLLVPEDNKIFPTLTVSENLVLSGLYERPDARRRQFEATMDIFPDLRNHLDRKAGLLSGGQRQMLAVASAICANPKVLLIDSPTIGLAPDRVEAMMSSMRALASSGLPIVLSEENAGAALPIADVVMVLEAGRVLASGQADTLAEGTVLQAFLGRAH